MTVLVSSSMVALANSVKPVGELVVNGKSDKAVTVNGEPAASGRTIFAASTITTPEGMTAVLDLGKAGKIELAPNTTYNLNSDGSLSGSLTAGTARVLNSASTVGIKTLTGETVNLNAGEMVTANSATAKKNAANASDEDWWIWVIIFGAAATAILLFTLDGDEDGPQASPTR
ncbi:MAG: hypothetical protein ACKVQW_11050 [Pyrinomonadaceae bacterium]